jgi:hypothetical protein
MTKHDRRRPIETSRRREGGSTMRIRQLVLALLAALLIAAFSAGPISAHGPCEDVDGGGASGMEYGLFHVSSHSPHGVGLGAHNPGTHQGFSLCLGVH